MESTLKLRENIAAISHAICVVQCTTLGLDRAPFAPEQTEGHIGLMKFAVQAGKVFTDVEAAHSKEVDWYEAIDSYVNQISQQPALPSPFEMRRYAKQALTGAST